jgi:hypothetical protein
MVRTMSLKTLLSIVLIALCFVGTTLAQESGDGSAEVEKRIQRLKEAQLPAEDEAQLLKEDIALPAPPPEGHAPTEGTEKAYQDALSAYYQYRRTGYDHRLRLFEWQTLSSKIIFVVVLALVASGIYFAAIQFHVGLRAGEQLKRDGQPEPTELVLSIKELKVRSPVLGVIVLAISLAFFYLYLVYVYPIEDVF